MASESPIKGIALMVLAMFLFVISDSSTKWLGVSYPVGQIVCIRNLFVLLLVAVLVWRDGGLATLRVADPRALGLRVFFHVGTTALIASSVILLPLADAEMLLFAAALFIALLAGPVLGERVGWRRMTAVVAGFAGVIVMLRPTPGLIQPLALMGVAAALFAALRDLWTRKVTMTESTSAIMVWSELGIVAAGGLTLFLAGTPLAWAPLTAGDLLLLAATGVVFGFAQFTLLLAYSVAPAATVSPFRYTAAIWAVLFGFGLWGEVPDGFIVAGATIVIASGLYLLHRETRRGGA